MTTALARTTPTAIAPATGRMFDVTLLAGQVAPGTLAQYKMYVDAYAAFARAVGADAFNPATLARWRMALYESRYTAADGSQRAYSVNAINLRLAAVRRIMREAAAHGYIAGEVADGFRRIEGLKIKANKERRKEHARTAITREQM